MPFLDIRNSLRRSSRTSAVSRASQASSVAAHKGSNVDPYGVSFDVDDQTKTYIIPRISESRLAQCFYRASEIARFRYQAFMAARFSAAAFDTGDLDDFDELFNDDDVNESDENSKNSGAQLQQQQNPATKESRPRNSKLGDLEEHSESSTSTSDDDVPIVPATTSNEETIAPVSPKGRARRSSRE